MKPPAVIEVGPFLYSVTAKLADYNQVAARDERFLAGHTDHATLRITLDPGQAEGAMRDTVLHETLHALMRVAALDDELGDKTEEQVVSRLTPLLLDVLRRNADLVAFITAS